VSYVLGPALLCVAFILAALLECDTIPYGTRPANGEASARGRLGRQGRARPVPFVHHGEPDWAPYSAFLARLGLAGVPSPRSDGNTGCPAEVLRPRSTCTPHLVTGGTSAGYQVRELRAAHSVGSRLTYCATKVVGKGPWDTRLSDTKIGRASDACVRVEWYTVPRVKTRSTRNRSRERTTSCGVLASRSAQTSGRPAAVRSRAVRCQLAAPKASESGLPGMAVRSWLLVVVPDRASLGLVGLPAAAGRGDAGLIARTGPACWGQRQVLSWMPGLP
jgi:hypothetical protein